MPLLIAALVVLWTTTRHELMHAGAALLSGTGVQEIRVLPGVDDEVGFFMGYVRYAGEVPWWVHGAPFIADAAMLAAAWLLLARVRRGWLRGGITIALVLSAAADLGFAYLGGLVREASDLNDLFDQFPNIVVHSLFVAAITASIALLRWPPRPPGPRANMGPAGGSAG